MELINGVETVSGASIVGITIDNTPIGQTTAAAGTFTTLSADSIADLDSIALFDSNDSHSLTITWDENDTSNRTLKFKVSTGSRVLTMTGDATIADWFDQSVKQADSPTFATVTLTNDLDVGDGGTGVSTFTDGGVLIGNSTSDIQVTSTGSSGEVLTSTGAGSDPTFQAVASGGDSVQEARLRAQAAKAGFIDDNSTLTNLKAYVDEYTRLNKERNWETMSMSTAQGATSLDVAYAASSVFDGRYMYFGTQSSATFLRFDTQGQFAVAGDWTTMSESTVLGAARSNAFNGIIFDGRYVYYVPDFSDTFLRFDTKGTSFVTTSDWTTMSMSTAQGATFLDNAYVGAIFDGRYVYFSA